VLLMVVAEAAYVLYYKRGESVCDICRELACQEPGLPVM
jgi:hypothetical protein